MDPVMEPDAAAGRLPGLAENFSQAWRLYRDRLWLALAVGAVGTAATVVSLVAPLLAGILGALVLPAKVALSAGVLAALSASLWFASWAQVALMEGMLAEERPSWLDCYRLSWPKVLGFSWVFILLTVAVLGGVCCLVLPGLYLGAALSLAPLAAVAEGASGLGALTRSLDLVRGRFWAVAVRLLVLSLIWLIAGALPFVGWLVQSLATLYLLAVFVILYRELSLSTAGEPGPAWHRRLALAPAALGLGLFLWMAAQTVKGLQENWPALEAMFQRPPDPQKAQQALALLQSGATPENVAAAWQLLQPGSVPLSTATVAAQPAAPAVP
jgi:hypothetical protein